MISQNACQFRDFIHAVEPIRMREPLAAVLGAFKNDCDIIEYALSDVIKMSGHACPTVSAAFVACRHAMNSLYADSIGQRGAISIMVWGEPGEGVYGVMAQVFGFITGACPETGFKGLCGLHKRKNLLQFRPTEGGASLRFDFARVDTKDACRVRIIPSALPSLGASGERRMAELLERNVWQGANETERTEFRDLWMKKVKAIAAEERNVSSWLTIEKKELCNGTATST